jgi:hypothetical protein
MNALLFLTSLKTILGNKSSRGAWWRGHGVVKNLPVGPHHGVVNNGITQYNGITQ